MEQHPVPQNVTTFQFRLIGDMTIKQFGYLIAGGILAVIAYKLPLPFVITWPLAGAFAFLGVGFAFIPVEERPMDVWVFSFFKSIYSPTQYIWSHDQTPQVATPLSTPDVSRPPVRPPQAVGVASVPPPHPTTQPQPPTPVTPSKTVLSGLFQPTPQQAAAPKPTTLTVAPKHTSFMDGLTSWLFSAPKAKPVATPPHPTAPSVTGYRPPMPVATPTHVVDPKANEAIHSKMTQLEETLKTLEERLSTKTVTEDRVLELQKQLTDVLSQKTKTEDELIALKRHLTTPQHEPPSPPPVPAAPTVEKPLTPGSRGAVNVITTQEGAVKAGLPRLTNVPNVITGLVRDDTGTFLPGILVTVTNGDGVPMRALKTNKLGQFAASTQLASGTYFVEVEDPRGRFTFSRVQITLNNAVVPILEIIAKSEKALTREKLAQEIFGKPSL